MTAGNDVSTTVEAVFADVLDTADLSPEVGFFDLGADSLAIVRAINRLRGRWPFLRPVDAFAHPTVAALVRYIESRDGR